MHINESIQKCHFCIACNGCEFCISIPSAIVAHLNDGVFKFVVSFSLKPVLVIAIVIFRYSTKVSKIKSEITKFIVHSIVNKCPNRSDLLVYMRNC